jgi:hypothetical protein
VLDNDEEEKSEFSKSFSKKLEASDFGNVDNVTNIITEDEKEQQEGGGDDDDDDDDDESTLAGGNTMMREDDDLWRTAWSQGRGVLNSDRRVLVEEDGEGGGASLPPVELTTQRKRRSRVCVCMCVCACVCCASPSYNICIKMKWFSSFVVMLYHLNMFSPQILQGLVEDSKSRTINRIGEHVFK